jgi:hypothetical protein
VLSESRYFNSYRDSINVWSWLIFDESTCSVPGIPCRAIWNKPGPANHGETLDKTPVRVLTSMPI